MTLCTLHIKCIQFFNITGKQYPKPLIRLKMSTIFRLNRKTTDVNYDKLSDVIYGKTIYINILFIHHYIVIQFFVKYSNI